MKEISINETKEILMNLIADLDGFCRKKGLRYSLAYGTLIGAVRHKGFIPWDDDIDILIPRPDYNRLVNEYTHPYYKLMTPETDSHWPLNFSKLCDTRTISVDSFGNKCSIAVDVFILDGLEDTYVKSQHMVAKVNRYHRIWSSLLFTRNLPIKVRNGVRKNIFILFSKVLGIILPLDMFVRNMLKYKQKNNVDLAKYCASLTGYCTIFEREKMLNYIDMQFEGRTLRVSSDYDYQLKMLFGDYMTLPPVEERINHNAIAYWK